MAKTGAVDQRGTVRVGSSRTAANGAAATRRAANGAATSRKTSNGAATPPKNGPARVDDPALARLEHALQAAAAGDFGVRLPARRNDDIGRLEAAYNRMAAHNAALEAELVRVAEIIGREGRMTERARLHGSGGAWSTSVDSLNGLIDDHARDLGGRADDRWD
jgi:HAMP domain-containing protein